MIHPTAKIVVAFLKRNALAAGDLSELIRTVHSALAGTAAPISEPEVAPQPAVPVKRSVTPSALICLDCGRPQKTLKRHLTSAHGLTPEQYRAKWSLSADYPMVAPDYAAHRSQLAIKIGLGRSRKGPEAAPSAPPERDTVGETKPSHRYPASRWSKPSD